MAVEVGKTQDIGSTALRAAVEPIGAAVVGVAGRVRVRGLGGSRRAAVGGLGRDGQVEGASRDSGSKDGHEDGELHFGLLLWIGTGNSSLGGLGEIEQGIESENREAGSLPAGWDEMMEVRI